VVPPTKAVEVPYRNVLNAQESSHFGRFRFRVVAALRPRPTVT
jgi:hypothetical protein